MLAICGSEHRAVAPNDRRRENIAMQVIVPETRTAELKRSDPAQIKCFFSAMEGNG